MTKVLTKVLTKVSTVAWITTIWRARTDVRQG